MKHLPLVVLAGLTLVCLQTAAGPQPGEILWSNQLAQATDLAGSEGAGSIATEPERGSGLLFASTNSTGSFSRSFALPVEPLRGRFVFVGAEVKAASVSAKPSPWNGIKIMVRIDSPAGSQWPQPDIPAGSFDWQRYSHRILVPANATAVTLILGLEHVSGHAWIRDVRIAMGRAGGDLPAVAGNGPIFRGHAAPRLRGAMVAPDSLSEPDLHVLAGDWGANLIRWQLVRGGGPATEAGFDNYDRWLDQQLNQLDRGLTWAAKLGVKVVVDLHSPPGGKSISGGYQAALGQIWTDPITQDKFVEVWRKIATRYHGDQRIWGYDLLNEPVDNDVVEGCDDWQGLALRAGQAVRSIDPASTLIIEPPDWGSATGFVGFQPIGLSNVVYSFHIYDPHAFTHQGVNGPSPPITYPGEINGRRWDKAAIESAIEPATTFAKRYRVQMYVGEFSVIRWAPGGDKYLSDLIEVMESHGWDWSYHAFREWDGWSVEYGSDPNDHTRSAQPTARKQVLLKWLRQNKI